MLHKHLLMVYILVYTGVNLGRVCASPVHPGLPVKTCPLEDGAHDEVELWKEEARKEYGKGTCVKPTHIHQMLCSILIRFQDRNHYSKQFIRTLVQSSQTKSTNPKSVSHVRFVSWCLREKSAPTAVSLAASPPSSLSSVSCSSV